MGTRRKNLLRWQWSGYAANHQDPVNLALHLLAVPLFLLGVALLLIGILDLHALLLGLGMIGILASLTLQACGHKREAQAPEPFSDRSDALLRLLAEQFVTFPRFLLGGGWLRAWRRRPARQTISRTPPPSAD